ncbi:hypothetical protein GRS48_13455 [Halorubrum sp. JWXQ-INN 858]|uniref:hypothetical protein n=1 Tax=Halorubrum sp. JWXQ-INN 858 TaxID=2690782 RepID=UPI001359C782|nr:hypothetical protein [Halorubrum sp. JWXQ-INN 858]MWV65819.1 hypothetical protein [Halorubrum sp. JWXQ-INN 858]
MAEKPADDPTDAVEGPSVTTDDRGESTTGDSPSIARRAVLSAAGAAGVGLAGIGAFAGSAAAWDRFDVDFRGCSSVWIVVDREDLDWESYAHREGPLIAKVVYENGDGEAACETVEFTRDTTTAIPGQYGDSPVLRYDGDGKILAVIQYNHWDVARCFVENDNRCAHTPNVADWRDADCSQELLENDPDRFNRPCSERGF